LISFKFHVKLIVKICGAFSFIMSEVMQLTDLHLLQFTSC